MLQMGLWQRSSSSSPSSTRARRRRRRRRRGGRPVVRRRCSPSSARAPPSSPRAASRDDRAAGGGAANAPAGVAQHVRRRRAQEAADAPAAGKAAGSGACVLIFANKIKAVHFVAESSAATGSRRRRLSRGRSPNARRPPLPPAEVQVLVATDVAGKAGCRRRAGVLRDFGSNLAQYVHRVGRTGARAPAAPRGPSSRATSGRSPPTSASPRASAVDRIVAARRRRGGRGGDEDDGGGGDDDDDDARRPRLRRCRRASGSAAAAAEAAGGGGGALRWLAKKMASPITGQLGTFGTGWIRGPPRRARIASR